MKRINTKQIHRLIENKVRQFLMEELDPMDTVMRDSDELDHSNMYDDMRIHQEMDSDWEDFENNNKYDVYKEFPSLAKGFNHNVEDGREEAEAYVDPYLNESHIKKVIRKNVRKVLNEEYCWWGDTQPIEEIMSACAKIVKGKNEDDFEYPDDRASYDLYKWANRVYEEAEEYLRYNAHNVSINGGEDW